MSRARGQELLCQGIGPFGPIKFPYVEMGKIDSADLFGPTELEIFAIYHHNRHRWKKVLDIGANLGLHSILMARLGMEVRAYEPDEVHFGRLVTNIIANHMEYAVQTVRAAVHTFDGTHKFVRVLNNLTGNHLAGYKASYGPLEQTIVPVVDCRMLWAGTDFAKIDCEGNEHELCKTMTRADMEHMSAVLEVRNRENAQVIYEHFTRLGVPMWTQKIDWRRVETLEHMPHKNVEGSLFVGHQGPFA